MDDDRLTRIMTRVEEAARREGLLNPPDEEGGEETIVATTAWLVRALRAAEQEEKA